MRKSIIYIAFLLAVVLLAACATPRRMDYLQDMTHGSQIEIENRFEARVAPYDELDINVMSADMTNSNLAEPFNHNEGGGYLVDVNGDIELPTLGRMHVAGLTRLQLQDTLAALLREGGYIPQPYVNVRFSNFKIFYLGNNEGRVLNVPNERCTFLEALAMIGDMDPYMRRDRMAVMREVNGRMVMRYLDPRSSDIFNDPFFMLQQNDFIIAPNYSPGTVRSEMTYWLTIATTLLSFSSIAMTLLLYRQMSSN